MKEVNGVVIVLLTTLLAIGILVSSFEDAFAIKSKGTSTAKFGSDTKRIVCGDKLCSEITDQQVGLQVGGVFQQGIYQDPRGGPGAGSYGAVNPSQSQIDSYKQYQNVCIKCISDEQARIYNWMAGKDPSVGPRFYSAYTKMLEETYKIYQNAVSSFAINRAGP